MKTNRLLSVIMAIGIAISLFSCKGDTGPAGPAGANGNANVIGQTFTVTSWGWSSPAYYVDVAPSALTASVQSSGTVSVFISIDAGTTWNAIPATHVGSVVNAFWSYAYQTNLVQVNFEWNDQSADGDPNATYSASVDIKVVCVAPSAMKKHPNTNWNDYAQVNAILETQKLQTN